jgi:prepilin-type N-terminal cleavage/methylation domain-containing protein
MRIQRRSVKRAISRYYSGRFSHRRAFTLIELLVSLAIIAVLASLLLSGLTTAKVNANSVRCKSNLRQISLALSLYVNEHGMFPLLNNIPGPEIWFDLAGQFLPGPVRRSGPVGKITFGGVFVCPSHRADKPTTFDPSYGYNAFGAGGRGLGGQIEQPIALGMWRSKLR